MTEDLNDRQKAELVFNIREDEPLVEPWDREVASRLAAEDGLELTDAHWAVVSFLRHHFEGNGAMDYARDLSAVLNQRFQAEGGLKHLYLLFPKGPVTQGSRIAGIPVPGDSTDASFGFSA
jgi:tRNA 2-thiouridine synthesizing protein E